MQTSLPASGSTSWYPWATELHAANAAVFPAASLTQSAIATALSAASTAGGGVVQLPSGTLSFSTGLTVPSKVTLRGAGRDATRLQWSASTGDAVTLAGANAHLENLTVEPSSGHPTAGALVVLSSGFGPGVSNLTIAGGYDNLRADNAYGWLIDNCYIVTPIRYGCFLRSIDSPDTGDSVIRSTVFDTSTPTVGTAIRYESGGGLKIGTTKILHHGYGIDLAVSDGSATSILTVAGCSIEDQSLGCVRLGKAGTTGVFTEIVFSGNQLNGGSSQGAFDIEPGVDYVTITGNTLKGSSSEGAIWVDGPSGVTVTGNTFLNWGRGIEKASGTSKVVAYSNNWTSVALAYNDDVVQRQPSAVTLYDDLTTKADGAPTKFDSGQAYYAGGTVGTGITYAPVISGGKLTVTKPGSGAWASYPQALLTVDATRIGCEFALETGATTGTGALTLILWNGLFAGGTSATPCHLVLSATTWYYYTKQTTNGAEPLANIAQGNYDTPLTLGTKYRAEAMLLNGKAYLFLPDGSLQIITDSSIATAQALGTKGPCWEPFSQANTDSRAFIYRLWADAPSASTPPGGAGVTLAHLSDAITKIEARRSANLPRVVEYTGSGTYNIATSTQTNLDATNLAITFTGPPSGFAILAFEAVLSMSVADTVLLGFTVNGPGVSGATYVNTVANNQTVNGRIRVASRVALGSGSYTATVSGFRVGSTGTVAIVNGGAAVPASITMTPCA